MIDANLDYKHCYTMLRDAVCGAITEAPPGAPAIVQRAIADRQAFADRRMKLIVTSARLHQLQREVDKFRSSAAAVVELCAAADAPVAAEEASSV